MTGVAVRGLGYERRASEQRLDNIDLVARPGELIAVVGTSGAGKSTLLLCLAGLLTATRGEGTVADVPVAAPAHARAGRVGYVPQDDALHTELTVAQELASAAEIRGFHGDEAARRVRDAVTALGLERLGRRRISQLSGGERKRVSVALELLSTPDVLLLDEATSGLDPLHERDLVTYLRRLADAGCAVVFTTHSTAHLESVDALLLLVPGGRPRWFGTPSGALRAAGTAAFADLFTDDTPLGGDRQIAAAAAGPTPKPRRPRLPTVVRREWTRLFADKRTLAFLVLQAPLLGLLVRAITGPDELDVGDVAPNLYARRVALTLVLCAAWLGATNSVREIVRDRAVARRERVAGVRGGDLLLAKLLTAWLVALVQVVVLAVVGVAGARTYGDAPVVGSTFLGIVIALWLCAGASAAIALAISAFARSSDQALAILPLILVPQLLLSGGVLAVRDDPVLGPLATVSSARWGMSAVASSTHLRTVESDTVIPHEVLPYERNVSRHEDADTTWRPTATAWTVDLAALLVLTVVATGVAAIGIRRA